MSVIHELMHKAVVQLVIADRVGATLACFGTNGCKSRALLAPGTSGGEVWRGHVPGAPLIRKVRE